MRAKPHIMRKMKSKKVYNILKAIGVFALLIGVCVSASLFFHTYYYDLIYVSGASMYPTLNGDEDESQGSIVDFGIVDPHESAKKNIKRFSIVSTYYPDSTDYDTTTKKLKPNAKKKIKRVVALPGETFEIKQDKLYVMKDGEFKEVPYTFKIFQKEGVYPKDTASPITLKDNEYWVLGDNRPASRDCASLGTPITYENIYGVLVAIEGKGKLYIKEYVCDSCGATTKGASSGLCDRCYEPLRAVYDVKNKQYHWPTFY